MTAINNSTHDLDFLEIDLLVNAILNRYGYDFSQCALPTLKQRITRYLRSTEFYHISELIPAILHDPDKLDELLSYLASTQSCFFNQPRFFYDLRKTVIPKLAEQKNIKIWHAGCATGEETYSLAILLEEAGIYDRTIIYATDYNITNLEVAREGVYPFKHLVDYQKNYGKSGGKLHIAKYCDTDHQPFIIDESLKRNIKFAYHNLASDHMFGEMDLIICRNVLTYYNSTLQDTVLNRFNDALTLQGYIGLSNCESLRYSCLKDQFTSATQNSHIYKRASLRLDV